MRSFSSLSEREMLALAIALEEEDARIYGDFADGLQNTYPSTAAILTLVGAINLPIIKFSVDWWNTLHQPASVFRMGGPTIDASILIPLSIMTIAFTLTFATLVLAAMRNEILRRRVRTLRLMQASAAS